MPGATRTSDFFGFWGSIGLIGPSKNRDLRTADERRDGPQAMMVLVSDASLVRMAVDGDVDAFTKLLREYDPRLRAVAFRMVGSQEAMDDVLQAAYLNAHRGLGRFRQDADFGTWLHRIVVNACYDHLRRIARQSEVSLHAVVERASEEAMEERLTSADAVQRALGQLSPEFRAVVVLVDGDGLTYAEAGEALGVGRGTVASRLNRARATLRDLLSRDEGEWR